jgi:hypothetical protein
LWSLIPDVARTSFYMLVLVACFASMVWVPGLANQMEAEHWVQQDKLRKEILARENALHRMAVLSRCATAIVTK